MSQATQRERRSWWVTALAAALLFVAVGFAAGRLPDPVHVYFTPTDRPDVEYPLWLYLVLSAVGVPIIAVIVGAFAGLISKAVALGVRKHPPSSGDGVLQWVSAWVLMCGAGEIWLAIHYGNGQPAERSENELALGTVALIGTALVATCCRWRGARIDEVNHHRNASKRSGSPIRRAHR